MAKNVLQLSTLLFVITVLQIHQGHTAHHTHTHAHVTPTHTPATVLAGKYNVGYVVRHDGCFEIQLDRQQFHALKSHHGPESASMQAELAAMVDRAVSIHEIDHHTIDTEHDNIQLMCDDLPLYRITVASSQ